MLKNTFSAVLITFLLFVSTDAQSLKYSADGKTMVLNLPVAFGTDKQINHLLFYDVVSGKIKTSINLSELEFDKAQMVFTGNGQSLMIADNGDTHVLKITADNKINKQEFNSESSDYENPLIAATMSADGKTFYKLHKKKLIAYSIATQAVIEESGKIAAEVENATSKNEFLAISSNGKVVVEYRKNGTKHSLVVHDLATNESKNIELPYKFEKNDEVELSAEISENGERLVLKCEKGPNSQITAWDLKTGLTLGTFTHPEFESEPDADFYQIKNIAISPNGKKIAVKIDEMFDDENDAVVLWDTAAKTLTNVEAKHYSEEYFAKNIAFSPDSKTLAVSSEVLLPNSLTAKVQLFDANTGKFIREF